MAKALRDMIAAISATNSWRESARSKGLVIGSPIMGDREIGRV
jgi:hypothetical protein